MCGVLARTLRSSNFTSAGVANRQHTRGKKRRAAIPSARARATFRARRASKRQPRTRPGGWGWSSAASPARSTAAAGHSWHSGRSRTARVTPDPPSGRPFLLLLWTTRRPFVSLVASSRLRAFSCLRVLIRVYTAQTAAFAAPLFVAVRPEVQNLSRRHLRRWAASAFHRRGRPRVPRVVIDLDLAKTETEMTEMVRQSCQTPGD